MSLSVVLAIGHVRAWRRARSTETDKSELSYLRRKFRRRMQVSLMIAATGIAILVGSFLPAEPMLWSVYWLAVMLWVVWIAILAAADMVDSRTHYGDLHHDQLVMRSQLEAELRRHQSQEGNGKADKQDGG
jgi:sterol desaturase/sphingolipid hydroxylase (fatty acid hydroxylase superfamily)